MTRLNQLEQRFSTFYARWTPKIIDGPHGPLNHQNDLKRWYLCHITSLL